LLSINQPAQSLEEAIQHTEQNLIRTAKELGNLWALQQYNAKAGHINFS